MKKIIFQITFLFLIFIKISYGKIFIGEEFYITDKKELKDEVLAVAKDLKISGECGSEIITIAKNLNVEGRIKGDFISASFKSEFNCDIENDLYMFGDTLYGCGRIKKSAIILGKDINCQNMSVDGNLRLGGGKKVVWNGNVNGKSIIWGNEIFLSGHFKNLTVYGKKISIEPNTTIEGDFIYHSNEKIQIEPTIKIKGKIKWEKPITNQMQNKILKPRFKKLFSFISIFIPFFIMLIFTPNLLAQTTFLIEKKPIKCFFTGIGIIIFISFLISILLLIIIFMSIFVAPLEFIISSIFLSLIYISRIFPYICIGRKMLLKLSDTKTTWILSIIIGICLFIFLVSIPKIGIFINIVFIPIGFGAFILGRLQFFKKLREEKIL